MTDTFRDLCAELLEKIYDDDISFWEENLMAVADRARTALAEGGWVGPSDEQQKALKELDAWIRERHGEFAGGTILCDGLNVELMRSAILAHPRPIPVAERLPTEADCDAGGRCWWWHPETMHFCGYWQWEVDATERDMDNQPAAWLPAAAIPLPEATP
jgi:hypothetical protein